MKPAHLLLSLAALLTAAGCSGSGPEEDPCALPSQPLGLHQPSAGILPIGAPAFVPVPAQDAPACEERLANQPLQPRTVTAQVYGPDNLLVPSDVWLDVRKEGASLRFTPTVPGHYHAIVSFAPVGGLHQLDLLAGVDRREAPAIEGPPVPWCTRLQHTSRGTWLCDGTAQRPDSPQSQFLGNVKVAVAGDVVWAIEPERVRRYVDTGTSLELTAMLGLGPPVQGTPSPLATGDELVVVDGAHLHRITFTEGQGLTAWPPFPWPALPRWFFGSDEVRGLLLRAGERLLRVEAEQATPTRELSTRVCPFQLGAQGGYVRAEEPCQTLPGTPVGSEPDVLWTRTQEAGFHPLRFETLYRWRVRDGRLEEEGVQSLYGVATVLNLPMGGGFSLPVLAPYALPPAVVPAWSAERNMLVLELMPAQYSDDFRAGPGFFWIQGSSLTNRSVQVYPR